MTDAAQKLFEEAMKLSPEERERLAQQLLDSTTAANDEMDAEELAALEEALDESERQFAAGEGREFFSAIAELRAQS
jgi:polyhydroxyalkanoate synthesis regulator phasin